MDASHAIAVILLLVLGAPPLGAQVGADLPHSRPAPSDADLQLSHQGPAPPSIEAKMDAVERRLRQETREAEPSMAGHLAAGVLLGAVAGTAVGGWLGYDNEVDTRPAGAEYGPGPEKLRDDDFMDEDAVMGGIVGSVVGGGLGVTIYRAKLP